MMRLIGVGMRIVNGDHSKGSQRDLAQFSGLSADLAHGRTARSQSPWLFP